MSTIMRYYIGNVFVSLRVALTALWMVGYWAPKQLTEWKKTGFFCYGVTWYMVQIGFVALSQIADLIKIWGNFSLMTATAFLLFTKVAVTVKIFNLILRNDTIRDIVDECNQELESEGKEAGSAEGEVIISSEIETRNLSSSFAVLSMLTVCSWAAAAEKNQLPLRAWYPWDTTKSPAYELTFAYQIVIGSIAAAMNNGVDAVAIALIGQCRCRLQLIALALRNLCQGLEPGEYKLMSSEQDKILRSRLITCIKKHQAALQSAKRLQACFSLPFLAQFAASVVVICVSGYQLAFEAWKPFRLMAMVSYLLAMMVQVFLYCYQGHFLIEDSTYLVNAACESPWYTLSVSSRRLLVIMMIRAKTATKLTACGLFDLSFQTYMAILKASYTFFTMLQQVVVRE